MCYYTGDRGLTMKKFLYVLAIIITGSIVLAETVSDNPSVEKQNTIPENNNQEVNKTTDYTTVIKNNENFYYDKYGKFIARDKKIKNQTFFYDKYGQPIGKSVKINEKTYYYNRINKFIGSCDENGCVDKDFVSTGQIPPLPEIKIFVPVYDNNIMNPPPKIKSDDEE